MKNYILGFTLLLTVVSLGSCRARKSDAESGAELAGVGVRPKSTLQLTHVQGKAPKTITVREYGDGFSDSGKVERNAYVEVELGKDFYSTDVNRSKATRANVLQVDITKKQVLSGLDRGWIIAGTNDGKKEFEIRAEERSNGTFSYLVVDFGQGYPNILGQYKDDRY